ncbi:hypothetical protein HA402_009166 [Bradysia odoriphaga]|nr:hypothetical protein HA402_009166 [Bradysia odoriphaga]
MWNVSENPSISGEVATSRSFKICFNQGSDSIEAFVVKPKFANLNSLAEELYIRKAELKNKSWRFYYKDSDEDKVIIVNAADFAVFLEVNTNKIFVEEYAGTNAAGKLVYTDEIRKFRHEDSFCGICKNEIYGFRYICFDCDDFNMCMDCEPKQIHMEHRLLRITNPSEGDKAYTLNEDDWVDEEEEEEEEEEDSDD